MKHAGQKSAKEELPERRKGPKRAAECRLKVPTHVWEQEARGSSPRTPTIFGRKTAFSGGFSALFVLLLQFCRLLFSDGSRGGNAVDTRTRTAAETAKSLTHP